MWMEQIKEWQQRWGIDAVTTMATSGNNGLFKVSEFTELMSKS